MKTSQAFYLICKILVTFYPVVVNILRSFLFKFLTLCTLYSALTHMKIPPYQIHSEMFLGFPHDVDIVSL